MKQISTKQKIIYVVIAAIIIAGIAVICTVGFNLDLMYLNSKRIDVFIGKDFEISEIKDIGKEVFDTNMVIQYSQITKDEVSITVKDASDEQVENLKNKINEKYNIKEDSQYCLVTDIPQVNIVDIVKPYILPVSLATLICGVYFAIRFRKQNILKVFAKNVLVAIITEAVYFSLIAIIRIPFGDYIIPVALLVYILTLMGMVCYFEKK